MIKITPLLLYIINQVKLRRLVLGYSAEHLSFILKLSHGYVISVEDPYIKAQYPTHQWPKLAAALGCELSDILPPEQSTSTGELVEKKVLSLSNEEDVKKVVATLKDHGFFNEDKSLEEVVKHLNVQDEKQIEVLKKVLEAK